MTYSLVTYAQDVRRFENEAEAIAAVFAAWPDASISIMIDEVDKRDHAVIWKDAAAHERYDQPVGWVAREVSDPGFSRSTWRKPDGGGQ